MRVQAQSDFVPSRGHSSEAGTISGTIQGSLDQISFGHLLDTTLAF